MTRRVPGRPTALSGAPRATALALALLVAGCGGTATPAPPSASPGSSASQGAGSASASSGAGSATVSPGAGSPSAPASAGPSPAIALDPSLLEILPVRLDGLDRQHDASLEAGDFADPTLPGIATAGSTALYIDPPTAQFAFAAVLRLRTGGLTDAQFRAWRDSFDAAACSQAGGVGGNAQATIAGHLTYIGTCTGGLTTYHTILAGRGLLVSISSVGDRRLGELLVKALPS